MSDSPYSGKDKSDWASITEQLIKDHPLDENSLVEMILNAWNNIFETSIGRHNLKIGDHIFPKPQVIGALMHELIPAEMAATYPKEWRGEKDAGDKDIVYIPNDYYSIELKTSSNPSRIFGNRSYAQKPTQGKKGKDGFYIAVNFEKFSKTNTKPEILVIRFGWLDHTDWRGQKAESGQQSSLAPDTYDLKFKTLYLKS
ncbi:ScaI family restriction endonuclease [Thiorhodococcus mannitoliphagus]|uniref:ScaI family restriction endonuclease n=1 Tax=Thiorhodococcus mannitoliphagus TaxID=329406 RepID=A0A6P1DYU8_9GAMM|nr:ScaI family restriction endonuclease [Thiorhodococcus mannitoliphagus]NEX23398.1 ScaI family restriction endonuclease [Thiorhodococcus mannitoliphagus]